MLSAIFGADGYQMPYFSDIEMTEDLACIGRRTALCVHDLPCCSCQISGKSDCHAGQWNDAPLLAGL